MTIDIKKMGLVFLVFIYIFVPPFLHVSTCILGCIFFHFYILINHKRIACNLNVKNVLVVTVGIMVLLLYVIVSYVIVYGSFENIVSAYVSYIYILLFSLSGAITICDICVKYAYTDKEIGDCIIYAGVVQGTLSFVAYIYDPIQTLLCELLKNIMAPDVIDWWRNYRLYGLSCSLTYGMPIAQSVIGGMALIFAHKYSRKYYILVPILWGSAIINARITMVVVMLELLLMCLVSVRRKPTFKVRQWSLLIFAFLVSVILTVVVYIITHSIDLSRIIDPILEIWGLLQGQYIHTSEGYFSYFFVDPKALFIPKNRNLLFGGGIWNNVSDVGYIYDLWSGGIIYSLLQYIFYLCLLSKWYKESKKRETKSCLFSVICGVTLFVANIKGHVFGNINEFINVFYLVLGVYVFIKKSEKERSVHSIE